MVATASQIVDAALLPGRLVPDYQPIVDLESHAVVGFEALARWPEDGRLDPGTVFGAAATVERTAEVDWACRSEAIRHALVADLPPALSLFVNVEPATLGQAPPRAYQELADRAWGRLRVVLELTERALLRDPAQVLRMVDWARQRGWGIAMDDVGAAPESLHFLPFVAPDVIKLDMTLTQRTHGPVESEILLAVLAQAEETGGLLLAEGIETAAHLDQALALGARYGQGWALGRPGPLSVPPDASPLPAGQPDLAAVSTPFDLVDGSPLLRRSPKSLLLELTHRLEERAAIPQQPSVLLSAFQHADQFTPATAHRYERLAAELPFVAAFGEGIAQEPAPGVRGARLDPDDALIGEWSVVVIGPHYAGALIARDCGDEVPDIERRFDYVLTHRRDLVLRAGRSLMRRIVAG